MADVIKEVVKESTEIEKNIDEVKPLMISGPTIFKTSKTSKIVFVSVVAIACGFGITEGIRCIKKKRKAKKEMEINDISEVDEADFTEVEEQ